MNMILKIYWYVMVFVLSSQAVAGEAFKKLNQESSDYEMALKLYLEQEDEQEYQRNLQKALKLSLQQKQLQKTQEGEFVYKSRYAKLVPALRQQDAECGYHAVFNTAQSFSEKTGRLFEASTFKKLYDVISQKRGQSNVQWLDSQEVEYLARTVFHLPENEFTVIGDITDKKSRNFLSQDTIDAIATLQKSNGAVHGFILGNMQQGETHATLGHWISVVVYRDGGIIHYDVKNSLGSNPETAMVNALISLVESPIADLMLGSESLMSQKINQIRQDLVVGLYNNALDRIELLLNYVHNASPTYDNKKVELREILAFELVQIDEDCLSEGQKRLKIKLLNMI